jgi:8-oxo-dGTP diphosphatase
MKMKRRTASILFVNDKKEILLYLRDNISNIPYPNCWCILGGHAEKNETFEQCIKREMQEEMELDLGEINLFKIVEQEDVAVHFFWKRVNFKVEEINLHEGQKIQWFSQQDIIKLESKEFAFHFKPLILEFFEEGLFVEDAEI